MSCVRRLLGQAFEWEIRRPQNCRCRFTSPYRGPPVRRSLGNRFKQLCGGENSWRKSPQKWRSFQCPVWLLEATATDYRKKQILYSPRTKDCFFFEDQIPAKMIYGPGKVRQLSRFLDELPIWRDRGSQDIRNLDMHPISTRCPKAFQSTEQTYVFGDVANFCPMFFFFFSRLMICIYIYMFVFPVCSWDIVFNLAILLRYVLYNTTKCI